MIVYWKATAKSPGRGIIAEEGESRSLLTASDHARRSLESKIERFFTYKLDEIPPGFEAEIKFTIGEGNIPNDASG